MSPIEAERVITEMPPIEAEDGGTNDTNLPCCPTFTVTSALLHCIRNMEDPTGSRYLMDPAVAMEAFFTKAEMTLSDAVDVIDIIFYPKDTADCNHWIKIVNAASNQMSYNRYGCTVTTTGDRQLTKCFTGLINDDFAQISPYNVTGNVKGYRFHMHNAPLESRHKFGTMDIVASPQMITLKDEHQDKMFSEDTFKEKIDLNHAPFGEKELKDWLATQQQQKEGKKIQRRGKGKKSKGKGKNKKSKAKKKGKAQNSETVGEIKSKEAVSDAKGKEKKEVAGDHENEEHGGSTPTPSLYQANFSSDSDSDDDDSELGMGERQEQVIEATPETVKDLHNEVAKKNEKKITWSVTIPTNKAPSDNNDDTKTAEYSTPKLVSRQQIMKELHAAMNPSPSTVPQSRFSDSSGPGSPTEAGTVRQASFSSNPSTYRPGTPALTSPIVPNSPAPVAQWDPITGAGANDWTPVEKIARLRALTNTIPIYRSTHTPTTEAQHPNHNRIWSSRNLHCTQCTIPCAVCGRNCCRYRDLMNFVTRESVENRTSEIGINMVRLLYAIQSLVPQGIDERTFVDCTTCKELVCPDCSGLCPIFPCHDRQCKRCKENPWAPCDFHP